MDLARRSLLAAGGLFAAAGTLGAAPSPALSPIPPGSARAPNRLLELAAETRAPFSSDPTGFDGPGWTRLVEEARRARLFMLGEEHGVWEVPMLTGALFQDAGYERLAIEVSPRAAADLDRAAQGGTEGLKALFTADPDTPEAMTIPFYPLHAEADLLARVKAAVGKRQALWGLDYEVLGNQVSIERLRAKAPKGAHDAIEALAAAERAAWKRWKDSADPGALFAFGGDPALVRAVRDAWPRPDADSGWILDTLAATLEINRLNGIGDYYGSNALRAELMRANFLRYWNADHHGDGPRVMFKMGGNHMIRGLNFTAAFDLGALVYETGAAAGGAFNLLVSGGAGSTQANFDPARGAYVSGPVETFSDIGIQALAATAFTDSHTFLDLRPLRPLAASRAADSATARVVLGYDALVVLKQTHASDLL